MWIHLLQYFSFNRLRNYCNKSRIWIELRTRTGYRKIIKKRPKKIARVIMLGMIKITVESYLGKIRNGNKPKNLIGFEMSLTFWHERNIKRFISRKRCWVLMKKIMKKIEEEDVRKKYQCIMDKTTWVSLCRTTKTNRLPQLIKAKANCYLSGTEQEDKRESTAWFRTWSVLVMGSKRHHRGI